MNILIIAPHPDDELLGCGGTLLKLKSEGHKIGTLIMTRASALSGWDEDRIIKREEEILDVSSNLGVAENNLYRLNYETSRLDEVPLGELVNSISEVIKDFCPNLLLIPHLSDAHSDHRITINAAISSSKWFRNNNLYRILSYETPSETGFNLNKSNPFNPNVFYDITNFLQEKMNLLKIYESELGKFPFPRSLEAVEVLARYRGTHSGYEASEAFELVFERNK